MAEETGTVWAIDIGNNSLKALCLSTERGIVEVIGFENIQHGKVLSGTKITDAEKQELVAISLRELVRKYDLSSEEVIVSVPSQNSFVRFVSLPPVEAKRIPEMVKFEAVQQIPFGINEVQWDWQMMSEPDSPEIKVGIFAIKNEIVDSTMDPLAREEIDVSYVQIAAMALYNYLLYDRNELFTSDNQGVVVLNVGAENTDLVVCTKSTVWQRSILIGGNTFTQAIADTFKLSFEKAEKLKRTAQMSKYARQIFQAMRPVFSDLASEVQRSLGFYNSANPNTKVKRIIAMGGGTKLRGLLKYLQQTLQIPVEMPDAFKKLALGQGVSQAKFHENVTDFGIVYGLALQGLGMAKIESNLLPRAIARTRAWASKGRYFMTAACLLLAVSVFSFGRTFWDKMQYGKNDYDRQRAKNIVKNLTDDKKEYDEIQAKIVESGTLVDKEFKIFDYRDIIPQLFNTIYAALPNEKNNPKQAELYRAYESGDAEKVKKLIPRRKERKQIFITNIVLRFTTDLKNSPLPPTEFLQKSSFYGSSGQAANASDLEYQQRMQQQNENLAAAAASGGTATSEKKDAGFLVTITGYCPYGNAITDAFNVIDPPKAGTDKDKWGFVTRFEHMDELFGTDVNSPFKLYNKTDPKHYFLDVREIDDSGSCPVGTGADQIKTYTTSLGMGSQYQVTNGLLIDPLTKEVISKITETDKETGGKTVSRVNDYWFVLKMKFLWKDAPAPPGV